MADFSAVVEWLLTYGYGIMFFGMLVEGPVVTAAAAFAVGLGYFDFGVVYVLSVLGDIIPDIMFYGVGYWGRETVVEKYGKYIGLTPGILSKGERLISRNTVKSLVLFKLAPVFSLPGIVIAGIMKIPAKKFLTVDLIFTFFNSLLFMVLGFYFGKIFETIMYHIKNAQWALLFVVVIAAAAYYGYKKISARLAKRFKEQ